MEDLISYIRGGKFIKKCFENREDFFKQLYDELLKEGYVTQGFYEGISNREKKFPTGIQTTTMGVSIPHCESKFVLKNAIVVVVFKDYLKFHRMDQPEQVLDTQVSFVLLIKDKENHLITLQQLVSLFKSNALSKITEANSLQEVLDLIREVFDD